MAKKRQRKAKKIPRQRRSLGLLEVGEEGRQTETHEYGEHMGLSDTTVHKDLIRTEREKV